MADMLITPSDVILGSAEELFEVGFLRTTTGTSVAVGTAGETITVGQLIYKNTSDGDRLYLADANNSLETAACVGLALNSAGVDQPVIYATAGPVLLGPVVSVAETYALSTTPGAIAPVDDITTGSYLTHVGYGESATILHLDIDPRGLRRVVVGSGSEFVTEAGDELVTEAGDVLVTE